MNTQTLEWTLGERLAKARRFKHWTQQEMAERLGIGRRSISRYEDDHIAPTMAVLIAWATVTGAPLEWLAGPNPDDTQGIHVGRWTEEYPCQGTLFALAA